MAAWRCEGPYDVPLLTASRRGVPTALQRTAPAQHRVQLRTELASAPHSPAAPLRPAPPGAGPYAGPAEPMGHGLSRSKDQRRAAHDVAWPSSPSRPYPSRYSPAWQGMARGRGTKSHHIHYVFAPPSQLAHSPARAPSTPTSLSLPQTSLLTGS